MPKRVIASLIAVSLALGAAGCHPHVDCSGFSLKGGEGGPGGAGLLLLAGAIWLAECSSPPSDTKVAHAAADKDRAAAEKGDAEAQYELGTRYAAGNGVPMDGAEAAKWYQKSATQGFARAQLALAFIYGTGCSTPYGADCGVGRDDVQADMWCALAASAEAATAETREVATKYCAIVEANMTPEQIAEARKRAQEWKPS